MGVLRCSDYGFVCKFVTKGFTEKIIDEFKIHMEGEHGIDYSKEALQLLIVRKNQGKLSKN